MSKGENIQNKNLPGIGNRTVKDRLFTRVIVFGAENANRFLGDAPPAVLLSAQVALAPDLDELATRGTDKQKLWAIVRRPATST